MGSVSPVGFDHAATRSECGDFARHTSIVRCRPDTWHHMQHTMAKREPMNILEVSNENPVVLNGYIDAAGLLQFRHHSGSLADHSQTLHAMHETSTTITVELHDFDGWQIAAQHDRIPWQRGAACALYTFAADMTDPVEVRATATNGTQTLKLKIYVKATPKGSLPIP
jgi:hypothetical protein